MNTRQAQAVRESAARVAARAAELMVAFPDSSVDECIALSRTEEAFIYGVPGATPVGLLGYSPPKDPESR